MNTSDNINSFSIRRSWASGRIYMPSIKRQLIIYGVTAICIYLINLLTIKYSFFLGIASFSLMSMASVCMLYFSPVVFARRSDVAVETMLPALPSEKVLFMIGHSLIAIPLVLYGIPALLNFIVSLISPDMALNVKQSLNSFLGEIDSKASLNPNADLIFGDNMLTKISNVLGCMVPISTCLFAVTAYRYNRTTMGIVWSVVSTIAQGLIGGLFGIYAAVKGFYDGLAENTQNGEEFLDAILPQLHWFVIVSAIISLVYGLGMLYLTYRKVKNRQI
ncbi:MAG: hypothetical protein J6C78_08145 [Muribaculaceae bacterium]|nr:hypothetical protein [Muribaculaceae bacterium]